MKKYFYELNYYYVDKNNDHHYFFIGYFSTLKNVEGAIYAVKDKIGFKDCNGNFEINKFAVNFSENVSNKSGLILYELSHEYLDDDGYDNFIIFGVYETYEEARGVQFDKIIQTPYSEHPEGFCIADVRVDLCGWKEGFSSW